MGAGASVGDGSTTTTPVDASYALYLESHVLKELNSIYDALSDRDKRDEDASMLRDTCRVISNVCGMLQGMPDDGNCTVRVAGSHSDTVVKVMGSIRDGLSRLDTPVSRVVLRTIEF